MIDSRQLARETMRVAPIPDDLEMLDCWADEIEGSMMITVLDRKGGVLLLGLSDGKGTGVEITVETEAAVRMMSLLDKFVNGEL